MKRVKIGGEYRLVNDVGNWWEKGQIVHVKEIRSDNYKYPIWGIADNIPGGCDYGDIEELDNVKKRKYKSTSKQ